jgi:hypothetical protein
MESAIPVSLATARTDAAAAIVQHSKATRNESANANDLTVSIFPLKKPCLGAPGLSGPFPHISGWGDFVTGALAIPVA